MEESTQHIRGLLATLQDYVNTRINLAKLKAAEKSSLLISNLVAGAIVAVVFLFFLLFVSVAGALALSAWIGPAYSGWLIIAGIYLCIGLFTWFSKEKLIRIPVMNNIIQQLFKEEGTPDEED